MPALYMLKLFSETGATEQQLNVFGYLDQLAIPVAADELTSHFETDVLPSITPVIASGTIFTRIEAYDMLDASRFHVRTLSPTVPGGAGGDRMPDFNAWGFQYNRAVRGQRSGAKRFSAIVEGDVTNGLPTSGALAALNTLAGVLGSPIMIGIVETWFPVILVRPPRGSTVWTSHAIAGVTFRRVTTQNTRKR